MENLSYRKVLTLDHSVLLSMYVRSQLLRKHGRPHPYETQLFEEIISRMGNKRFDEKKLTEDRDENL